MKKLENSFHNSSSQIGFYNKVKSYFRFDEYGAVMKKEIIGGISTFLAMCYILAVNPSIVGLAPIEPGNELAGLASKYHGGLFLAVAISSSVATFFMGLWARVPVAVAPGMGLNAFFAFNVAASVGFGSALTVTIVSGILYFIVVMTPLRSKIIGLIPHNYKIAVGVAIGFFIAYLGMQSSGMVKTGNGLVSEIGNFTNPLVITAFVITAIGLLLHFTKVPGGILITMLIGALIVIILVTSGTVTPIGINSAGAVVDKPNYGLVGSYADFASFDDVVKAGWVGFTNKAMWTSPMTYIGILSFLYMDFFDTTGSLIVINGIVKLDEKDKNWFARANKVDALSTIFGAGIGATTVTSYVESTVGISAGAKTGFSALVVALLFALAIPLWPIMQVFMPIAIDDIAVTYQPITAPLLIVVGAIMISQIRYFEWEISADIPVLFVTIITMTLFNSIAFGLSFGMIIFVLMNLGLGLIQKFTKREKIVESNSIPHSDIDLDKVKTKDLNYLQRLNPTCIIIADVALLYIAIDTWIKAGIIG